MELMHMILQELQLRDEGKRGRLENLNDLEVIALAYKLGLTRKKPIPKLRE